MKQLRKYSINTHLLTVATIISMGCEGYIEYKGDIVSTENSNPIDSAEVILYLDDNEWSRMYSDSNGKFDIGSGLVGCVPSCPDSRIEIFKKGYEYDRRKDVGDTSIYYMKPLKNE